MKKPPTYPHFLGIGAQKCGTTWLHANLRTHPDICSLHAIKEIAYFNCRGQNFWALCRNPFWQSQFRARLRDGSFGKGWKATAWYLRYFFLPRTDSWYASLFRACETQLIGDISPTYSFLEADGIAHVAHLMPNVKLILLLRDPVERAWSHARMDLRWGFWPFASYKGCPVEDVPFDLFRQHLDGRPSELRGDYLAILNNWGRQFSADQIFIGFMEEIEHAPEQLLDRIAEFIGVRANHRHDWPKAKKRVLAQAPLEMPARIRRYLSRKYFFSLKDLEKHELLSGSEYVRQWREKAELHLE